MLEPPDRGYGTSKRRRTVSIRKLSVYNYRRTSRARTSLGPWKFVLVMGSSSHWGLIIAPGQEVKGVIAKTRLYSFDTLKPHFDNSKPGFTGVYINFLISAQKHRLWVLVRTASSRTRSWYSLEPPCRVSVPMSCDISTLAPRLLPHILIV